MTSDALRGDAIGSAGPSTKRVVRTEHRQRPLRAGIGLLVIGAAALLGGALLSVGLSGAEVLGAIDRAPVGSPITFDAESRSYALVFIRGEFDTEEYTERAMANLRCDVSTSDGSVQTIDGSSQAVFSTTDFGSSIGTFDAPAGPTSVLCTFIRDPGGILQNYALAPERAAAKIASYLLFGVGLLLAAVGGYLIVVGLRGRSVVERVPI